MSLIISNISDHKFVIASAITGIWLLVRSIRRSNSPIIESKLCCPCGKIKGKICAKKEDSLRIYCYCTDCRDYANKIAELGDNNKKALVHTNGEAHLVQVCKSGVVIEKGQEYLKLARSAPNKGMYRYYAGCCHVPIMNTVDSLGFVGVYDDNLDQNIDKFVGPYGFMVKEALHKPIKNAPSKNPEFIFLGNLIKYIPWRKSGPFDYSLPPIFWATESKKTS